MGLDWAKDQRRRQRAQIVADRVIQGADTASGVFAEDPADERPICLICDKPVTPGGDDSHQMKSGSWSHQSCIDLNRDLKVFEIEREMTVFVRYRVMAVDSSAALAKGQDWEVLEREVLEDDHVVAEIKNG